MASKSYIAREIVSTREQEHSLAFKEDTHKITDTIIDIIHCTTRWRSHRVALCDYRHRCKQGNVRGFCRKDMKDECHFIYKKIPVKPGMTMRFILCLSSVAAPVPRMSEWFLQHFLDRVLRVQTLIFLLADCWIQVRIEQEENPCFCR